ncbi:MAG: amidase [Thermomicrobiales bacterium]|nr:amidase [Thermomicrobiales bacterium]
MSQDLCFMPATELLDRYRSRELSPVEVTDAVLTQIETYDPAINAFVAVTGDMARQQAKEAEAAYQAGTAGPLAGVPISIKDLAPLEGVVWARGSLIYADAIADEDAPFITRVKEAGAVIVGKTTTPEFGWKGETTCRVTGSTHNPWKYGRTPGGSSGGAGAAAAAGMGPLAQGSDGAGSIRIPSCFSGIFGLKPSFGLVPQYPASSMLDASHMGPMTRTVADAALLMNVTAGMTTMDRWSWSSGVDYVASLDPVAVKGLRVAWSPDLGYAPVEPEMVALVEAAAAAFAEAGATVEAANPGLPDPWDIVDTIWSCGMAGLHKDNLDEIRDLIDPGRLEVIESASRFTGVDVANAQIRRNAYYDRMRRFFDSYDLLLTPTLPCEAYPVGQTKPDTIAGSETTYLGWTAFTYPFNLTGNPAATVPAGFTANGLPVGLQIVGRRAEDALVLSAAAAFEQLRPWAHIRPDLEQILADAAASN